MKHQITISSLEKFRSDCKILAKNSKIKHSPAFKSSVKTPPAPYPQLLLQNRSLNQVATNLNPAASTPENPLGEIQPNSRNRWLLGECMFKGSVLRARKCAICLTSGQLKCCHMNPYLDVWIIWIPYLDVCIWANYYNSRSPKLNVSDILRQRGSLYFSPPPSEGE